VKRQVSLTHHAITQARRSLEIPWRHHYDVMLLRHTTLWTNTLDSWLDFVWKFNDQGWVQLCEVENKWKLWNFRFLLTDGKADLHSLHTVTYATCLQLELYCVNQAHN
jgi:hypothetical protein